MKNLNSNIILAGLTGGIGSGKSTVAKIIRAFGFPVYDSDYEAKKIMENNRSVRQQLLEIFGNEVFINGKIDNGFIAQKVFSDKNYLQKINQIVHPAVFEDFMQWVKSQNSDIAFMESAIIFENSLEKYFDCIISVISPQEIKIQRVMQRTNLPRNEIEQRISNQFSDEILLQKSDFVITNDEKEPLLPQIIEIIKKIQLPKI